MPIGIYDVPNPILTVKSWYDLDEYDKNYQRLKVPPENLPKKLIIEDADAIWLGSIEARLYKQSFRFVSEIEVCKGSPSVKVIDNIIYSKDGKELICCLKSRKGKVIIPEGVEVIGYSAFYKSNISEVVFPDSLRLIRARAFMFCKNLNNVYTNNIETIEYTAFYDCCKLKDIEFGKELKKIGNESFAHTIIESVTLPENLKDIGRRAFANSHLREVTSTKPTKKIEKEAFITVSKINMNTYDENLLYASIEEGHMKSVYGSFLNNDDYTGHFLLLNISGKEIIVPKYIRGLNLHVANLNILRFAESQDLSYIISLHEYGETRFHQGLAAIEILKRYDSEPAKEFLNEHAKDVAMEFPEEYLLSMLKMDVLNVDALMQMLEATQAKEYKVAAAYILEKINSYNKENDG